ncbi:MAG: hypothetical protein PHI41_00150 [Erysipelotrichaceae bacterium]|nr:hypothetical protein [Erysipelotrichaceae bacterium]MDD3808887.1 hypothetical protein [Erysipelotrichaceae bacterium]
MYIINFIILFLVVFTIFSIFIGLIQSPIFWIILGATMIYGMIKRHMLAKRMEEYLNQNKENSTQHKSSDYYQSTQETYRSSNDVIDVDYEVVDEETND